MSWFSKWMGTPAPAPEPEVAIHAPSPGQIRMTLDERMALRRKMVLETVQEVLNFHGLTENHYRINAMRVDERGHQYAVLIDLLVSSSGRTADSIGEWHATEAQIGQMAMSRYRIKVGTVYWRFDPDYVFEQRAPAEAAGHAQAEPEAAAAPEQAPSLAALGTGALAAMLTPRAHRQKVDDFPDTQIDERKHLLDGVSADELMAFEEAIRQGQANERPLKLGQRTYQTDYMPLE